MDAADDYLSCLVKKLVDFLAQAVEVVRGEDLTVYQLQRRVLGHEHVDLPS
jgi:hypothetical protein